MKNRLLYKIASILAVVILVLSAASCGTVRRPGVERENRREQEDKAQRENIQAEKPPLPKAISTGENQEPRLKVYIKEEDTVKEMPFEEYVAGVVGGEIKNDWPIEAIKAQAIIARTFVLRFIADKGQSKYQNAHVSTDIEEAQAWDMNAVNDNIRNAVKATRGKVLVYDGRFAYTWFHSNAAGKTATALEGMNYKEENPPYIKVVDSPDDSRDIPEDEKNWTVEFPKSKVLQALEKIGRPMEDLNSVSIGEKGPSGRAMTIKFNDGEVPAPELRIALGSTELKSTLLDGVSINGDNVVFKGRGYGHGVGMSQWGAYSMAKDGKKAKDIINHYFKGVDLIKMWD
jgi:stage II sporulation protein D